MSDQSWRKLLACLCDGKVHSGQALGEELGISRAAVWKQIQQAQAAGIPLIAHQGAGYQLAMATELLDADRISAHLSPELQSYGMPAVTVLFQVDSTNNHALMRLREDQATPFVVLAEMQTAGRGRRGRHWFSPFGTSIYLSLGWRYSGGFAALEGLSLVVGLTVLRCLQSLGAKS